MTEPVDSEANGNVPDRDYFRCLVNQRKGHRSYAKKVMNCAVEILQDYNNEQRHKLISCKTQLADKIDILSDFDDKISNLLPGEKIQDDIIQYNEYWGDMQAMIIWIDVTLGKSENRRSNLNRAIVVQNYQIYL